MTGGVTVLKDYWYMCSKLLDMITNFKYVPYKLKKGVKHKVGSTYWIGYWQQTYTVLEINGNKIKVKWDDGKIVEHMTSLDPIRDYELKPFEYDSNEEMSSGKSFTAAEIKALAYNELNFYHCGEQVVDRMIDYYFNNPSSKAPNDYTYYFITTKTINGRTSLVLKRDLKRSPHDFSNIKTLGQVYADKRLQHVEFKDKNDNDILSFKFLPTNIDTLPDNTKVLSIEPDIVFRNEYIVTLDVEL